MDFGLEIDGCFYDMAVCPEANSPIVTKMLLEKIPIIYRYVEEGSCFVTKACAKIEQLCRRISIPKELAESMQPSNGAELGTGIERILHQSIEAIDCINRICSYFFDFQDSLNQRYEKVEETTKQLKEIAKAIELMSEDYATKLDNLRFMIEDVMDAVRKELTNIQAVDKMKNILKESLRQATAEYEASKQDHNRVGDAVTHLKRCINMVPESLMGPGCKLFNEGATSKEMRRNRKDEVDKLYKALHYLDEQIKLREQELGEDHEIHLRMSILILEAKFLDLQNAVKFLDSLRGLSVFHEAFYADLPIVLCGLRKMSKEEMDTFKYDGISLNARWVVIQRACTDYINSSIVKDFGDEESDSD